MALEEAAEARRPRTLLRSAAIALAGTRHRRGGVVGHRPDPPGVAGKLVAAAEKTVAKSKIADLELLHGMRIADFERRLVTTSMVGLDLVVVYCDADLQSSPVPLHQALGRIAARVPVDDGRRTWAWAW